LVFAGVAQDALRLAFRRFIGFLKVDVVESDHSRVVAAQPTDGDAGGELLQALKEFLLGLADHSTFFVTGSVAFTQDQARSNDLWCVFAVAGLGGLSGGLFSESMIDSFNQNRGSRSAVFLATGHCLKAAIVAKMIGLDLSLLVTGIDEATKTFFTQSPQVVYGRDASIDDDNGLGVGQLLIAIGELFEGVYQERERGRVLGVTAEGLVRQFEAKFVEDHADNNLWTVVALLLVLAALGLGIVGADTLEVRICQVVEDDSALEVEAFFLGVSQVGFDLVFGRQELVADAIVAVIGKVQDVAAEQVREGTGVSAVGARSGLPSAVLRARVNYSG